MVSKTKKIVRSSVSGKFAKKSEAKSNKRETVTETVKVCRCKK